MRPISSDSYLSSHGSTQGRGVVELDGIAQRVLLFVAPPSRLEKRILLTRNFRRHCYAFLVSQRVAGRSLKNTQHGQPTLWAVLCEDTRLPSPSAALTAVHLFAESSLQCGEFLLTSRTLTVLSPHLFLFFSSRQHGDAGIEKNGAVPASQSHRPGTFAVCGCQMGKGVEGEGLPPGRSGADLGRAIFQPYSVH